MPPSNDFLSPSKVVLSWFRQDIEQRLLFRGPRFTQVNYTLSGLTALALAGITYLCLLPFEGSTLYVQFMGPDPVRAVNVVIPCATVFLAWWCLAILFLKSRKLSFQRRTLALRVTPDTSDFVLSSATVDQILNRIYELVDDPKQFVLFNRIEIALSNLRNLGRVTDVDEILRTQNENDEFLDASYVVLGGFMWAIPILGFIGTVLGLSMAIGGFSEALKSSATEGNNLISSLKGVVGGLGTAFDTTLIALVAALGIQMWITFLRKAEQEFLDSCSEYCLRNIVNRLRIMPYQNHPDLGSTFCREPELFRCLGIFFFPGVIMVTERDLLILRAVARYYVLNREQIQRLIFPDDADGRIARRRLQSLVSAHLLHREPMVVAYPANGVPAPIYRPTRSGLELLAELTGDDRLLGVSSQAPSMHEVWHLLAGSETHIAFDQAIALQTEATIVDWFNEYDIVNPDETTPELRFRLYTLLRATPRLVCAPDAAFLLNARGHSKVFYLEQDRATSGVHQIAASKTQGYAVLAEVFGHRRHFPQATVDKFTVLMVAPTARRRDALKKALRDKPGAKLWRFASSEEMQPERVLHEPIWHPCEGEPAPLIKSEAPPCP